MTSSLQRRTWLSPPDSGSVVPVSLKWMALIYGVKLLGLLPQLWVPRPFGNLLFSLGLLPDALSTFLWVYTIQRVRQMQRVHKVKALDRLLVGMWLLLLPTALPWLLQSFVGSTFLSMWSGLLSFGAFFGWVFIHTFAQSMQQRAALLHDQGEGWAMVSAQRERGDRLVVWPRWVQWAALAAAISGYVVSTQDHHPGMWVCGASALVVMWAQTRWVWRNPQRGATLSVWLTLGDLLLPTLVASLLGVAALLVLGMDMSVNIATLLAAVLVGVGVLLQVPTLLARGERRRWLGAWEEDIRATNPARVMLDAGAKQPTSDAVSVQLCADLMEGARGSLNVSIRSAGADRSDLLLSGVQVVITGDEVFDRRFQASGAPLAVLGLLTAQARAAALGLSELDLRLTGEAVTCRVAYPWRAQWAAQALDDLAALLRLPREVPPPQALGERARSSALRDPLPMVRCLCAQALLADWRAEATGGEPVWARLRDLLAHDPPSVALLDALSECAPSASLRERLLDPTPWPEVGGAFAQALWVLALDQLNDEDERAALSPPTGRLAALDAPFAVQVAVSAGALEVHTAEPWVLEVLARARYAEHRVKLCQALAVIGTVHSLSALRVLAHDEDSLDTARDAARQAADAIARRSDLSDIVGGLALSDASDSGALSVIATDPSDNGALSIMSTTR
jgi:hypothetical protein